jgi:hypothetical protein
MCTMPGMPSAEAVLSGLAGIANEWRGLAVAWHVYVGSVLIGLLAGWRPSARVAGSALLAPLLSVSAMAWVSGNPFNGAVFGALTLALAIVARGLSGARVAAVPTPALVAGLVLVAYGWGYPHFLVVSHWSEYAYAAPLGLLPCPTLAAIIGLTLMFGLFRSRPWSLTLATAGLAYGAIGVFRLGVTLDYGLLAGTAALLVYSWDSY